MFQKLMQFLQKNIFDKYNAQNSMKANKLVVYGIVILSMVFWSMTYIWYKIVFVQLNPITVMTFRLGISAFTLVIFSLIIKKFQIPTKSDFFWFVILSIFQPFLYFLAESYGVSLVSSTVSAVIISTIPIFTPIVAYLFLNDKISRLNIIGIVISFIGVIMVVLGKDFYFSGSIKGIILLFCAVLSALGYAVVIVRLTHKYNSFTIISWQNIIGTLMFLPLFFIFDFNEFRFSHFTDVIIVNILYLAILGSSVAYVFFTYAIKNIGITKASLFTNLIPVFTAIFAYYFLKEELSLYKIIGVLVVVFGLFLGQTKSIKVLFKR